MIDLQLMVTVGMLVLWFGGFGLGKRVLARRAEVLTGVPVFWRMVSMMWLLDRRWRSWGIALLAWLLLLPVLMVLVLSWLKSTDA